MSPLSGKATFIFFVEKKKHLNIFKDFWTRESLYVLSCHLHVIEQETQLTEGRDCQPVCELPNFYSDVDMTDQFLNRKYTVAYKSLYSIARS